MPIKQASSSSWAWTREPSPRSSRCCRVAVEGGSSAGGLASGSRHSRGEADRWLEIKAVAASPPLSRPWSREPLFLTISIDPGLIGHGVSRYKFMS
jgi:hypothetical protein